MKCFVTGATGFVGSNLVHELVAQGHEVRALVRPGADLRALEGVKFERVEGDVFDRDKLRDALYGCDWCFHVAALYHLWMRDYRPMYAVNVTGTQNVLEIAGAMGCSRIVYTSTVGCVGLPVPDASGRLVPSDETVPAQPQHLSNPYKRSKWQAEQIAFSLVRKGLPIVIVNPSGPVGPRDVKPTPTGRFILDFLNRRMPAYLDTGLNWVHVRDVARGHILAAQKGRIGERYILGHAEGNWTMRQTLEVLSRLSGLPAPRWRLPWSVAMLAACVSTGLAYLTGRPPSIPLAGVRMARYKMWFNPAKAIRELDLPQTPPEEAFAEAIEWFRAHGYTRR